MGHRIGLLIATSLVLSGCIQPPAIINTEIPTGQDDSKGNPVTVVKPITLDRNGSYAISRISEDKVKIAYLKKIQAEKEASIQEETTKDPTPEIYIDNAESMREYANYKNMQSMADITKSLAAAFRSLVSGNKKPVITFTHTPAPKGEIAEIIEVTGGAIRKTLDAPVVGTVGTLIGAGVVADKSKSDQPGTYIGSSEDVVIGSGVIDKPVTSTEVLQPAVIE